VYSSESTPLIDLSTFDLPVLIANEHELGEHEKVLVTLDKASRGKTVWRMNAN
jgi:DNA polymerase-3 subunit epsilon